MAKDILDMKGVNPGEPVWVVPSEIRGKYIVEEGNRRITALKLMENPAIADGTSQAKAFRRLAKIYADSPIREVEVRIFGSREEVLPWKRRRHMTAASGVGLAPWKPMAKGRANRDVGAEAPRFLAVAELLADEKDAAWNEVAEALDNRWTTVDRVLNADPFSKVLGVHIDPKTSIVRFENGDAKAGRALLMRILSAIAAPEFDFAEIEDKEDRERFIKRFAAWSVKGASPEPHEEPAPGSGEPSDPPNTPVDDATPAPSDEEESARPEDTRSRRDAADAARRTLAPDKGPRLLAVTGARLGPLYAECRKIKVKGNENAAAFLLRVFIELSSEALLHEKAVKFPRSLRDKNITSWDDYKVKLSDKITAVALHLDPANNAKEFQQARLSVRTDHIGASSITTLHGYFHNRHLLPDAESIKATWDGWESYLREVHKALNAP
ncbi:MAG: hypothetical protein ACT6SK_00420 [Phenylobacterium sp.]|uniref:hypothetical protein n=1 Tax=Phenylobacterium sp. TaxID=1871053 RepID=UPI00403669F1